MGRKAPLPSDTVPILHDGPLYHCLVVDKEHEPALDDGGNVVAHKETKAQPRTIDEIDETNEVVVVEPLILNQVRQLLLLHHHHPGDDVFDDSQQHEEKVEASVLLETSSSTETIKSDCSNNNDKTLSFVTKRLWWTLVGATALKDQLHALQTYKSTLLQDSVVIDTSNSNSGTSINITQHDSSSSFLLSLQATFRIMLEWSLSSRTPNALRKALQSNLLTLTRVALPLSSCSSSASSFMVVDDLYRQVIRSILIYHDGGSFFWSKPWITLSEVVSFTETRRVLAQDTTLTQETLDYVVHLARPIQCTFQTCLFPSTADQDMKQEEQQQQQQQQQQQTPHIRTADPHLTHAIQSGIQMAGIVQVLLLPWASSIGTLSSPEDHQHDLNGHGSAQLPPAPQKQKQHTTLIHDVKAIFRQLLSCLSLSSSSSSSSGSKDGLSVVGIALGRALMYEWHINGRNHHYHQHTNNDDHKNNNKLALWAQGKLNVVLQNDIGWSALVVLAVVHGMAATLPWQALVSSTTMTAQPAVTISLPVLLDSMACFFLRQVRTASDTTVRLAALKGLHTLSSRCLSSLGSQPRQSCCYSYIPTLVEEAMQVVLQAWENPSGRQVASFVPVLFQSLIALLQHWETLSANKSGNDSVATSGNNSDSDNSNSSSKSSPSSSLLGVQDLIQRVLTLPYNRTGRYLALEALLPMIPTQDLLLLGSSGPIDNLTTRTATNSSTSLLESLLCGVADGGHGAGAIADLWAKVISRLLVHYQQQKTGEGEDDNNAKLTNHTDLPVKRPPNRKERKKMLRGGKGAPALPKENDAQLLPGLSPQWLTTWVPSLARVLLGEATTFTSGGNTLSRCKQVANYCLPRIEAIIVGGGSPTSCQFVLARLIQQVQSLYEALPTTTADGSDQLLWTKLVIIQHSGLERHIKTASCEELKQAIVMHFPVERYWEPLTHSSDQIRLVAFQAMETVVAAAYYRNLQSAYDDDLEVEMDLWKRSLPYNCVSEAKEFIPSLMKCLLKFLDRLSQRESHALESDHNNNPPPAVIILPKVHNFVVDFLIQDFFVQKAVYPGTTLHKEGFALELLECILIFTLQNKNKEANLSDNNKLSNSIIQRRRKDCELATADAIFTCLVEAQVFAALLTLLHSMWDSTRTSAYNCLCCIVQEARHRSLDLPNEFASPKCRQLIQVRGLYLASSPRQREADTGAKMLAFVYLSIPSEASRRDFVTSLATLLEDRLQMIEYHLGFRTNNRQAGDGDAFPLVHGILHAVKLIMELERGLDDPSDTQQHNCMRLVLSCMRALQISLTVIADVKEGEEMEGMGSEQFSLDIDRDTQPFNINSGAIGANGTFSSVHADGKDRQTQRLAVQRVIVGSCLIAKEACNTMAIIISGFGAVLSIDVAQQAGSTLISTLASVKHAGVAFAAHRALQQIALSCLKSSVDSGDRDREATQLPSQWAARMWQEISTAEKVRNSTLRRSTGYGLAFLAVMRSEASLRKTQHALCGTVLSQMLKLSLPSKSYLVHYFDRMNFHPSNTSGTFLAFEEQRYGTDSADNYEVRCRIHALNILRLVILDAPLASETKPIAGAAIATSIVGYDDPNWAVRNSATMVFASVMLRIVDPDKNAANRDSTSRSAITLNELFLCYPLLAEFLLTVLQSNIAELTNQPPHNSRVKSESLLYPPLLPILLLLSRVESVAQSGSEAAKLAKPYVHGIIQCLTHRHESIRRAAARALGNLRSADDFLELSSAALLRKCLNILDTSGTSNEDGNAGSPIDWNRKHGALLGIQALLEESSTLLFEDTELYRRVVCFATWGEFSVVCPPDCVSVALETWSSASFRNGGTKEINRLTNVCQKVVTRLSCMSGMIGLPRLACVAARIICKAILGCMEHADSELSNSHEFLDLLPFMLTFDEIDVRLEFVKVFKKGIYLSIDRLTARSDLPMPIRTKLLRSIYQALSSSLLVELNRGRTSHPPTIRRMSRCLLECVDALRQCQPNDKLSYSHFSAPDAADLWKASHLIIDRLGSSRIGDDEKELSMVSGNAAELMGVAIGIWLERNEADDLTEKISDFFQLTLRLSDPWSSWRLRYSAAIAIDASCLLQGLGHLNGNINGIQHRFYFMLLKMLQDSDCDVRLAASRVLQRSRSFVHDGKTPSFVPLVELTKALSPLQNIVRNGFADMLFQEMLDSCTDIDCIMEQTYNELQVSLSQTDASSDLLNVGMERKIFEDEDPNSCFEVMVLNQLAARALLARSPDDVCETNKTVQEQLMATCHKLLSIYKRSTAGKDYDLIHDLTRCNAVFPCLHSLILGSICVIHRGVVPDSMELKLLASSIVEQSVNNTLHPRILEALTVLHNAKAFDDGTYHEVCKCCFLLPNDILS